MCESETVSREPVREWGATGKWEAGCGNPKENEILTITIIFEYDERFSRIFFANVNDFIFKRARKNNTNIETLHIRLR